MLRKVKDQGEGERGLLLRLLFAFWFDWHTCAGGAAVHLPLS